MRKNLTQQNVLSLIKKCIAKNKDFNGFDNWTSNWITYLKYMRVTKNINIKMVLAAKE